MVEYLRPSKVSNIITPIPWRHQLRAFTKKDSRAALGHDPIDYSRRLALILTPRNPMDVGIWDMGLDSQLNDHKNLSRV